MGLAWLGRSWQQAWWGSESTAHQAGGGGGGRKDRSLCIPVACTLFLQLFAVMG
jgi:hypothetical protein